MNSQIGQDDFVIEKLNSKIDGNFVDIGAGHPVEINNTYLLEKNYNWTGISFDIGPPHTFLCSHLSIDQYKEIWSKNRSTKLYVSDCRNIDFEEIFAQNNLPNTIDYLSIDLEPPEVTLEVLKKLPYNKYRFNVITFEHDYYRNTNTLIPSREFLTNLGYFLEKTVNNQEDWYVLKN